MALSDIFGSDDSLAMVQRDFD